MNPIPTPAGESARQALQRLVKDRNVLAALEAIHDNLGDIFQLPLPGFKAVMMVGPEANRFVLADERDHLRWRAEGDPVTRLLRHGLLVEDNEAHDSLRRTLNPALHRKMLNGYVESMVHATDQIADQFGEQPLDMLVEMRKVALLILTDTLFRSDFTPHLNELWQSILRTIQYISPGLWLIWSDAPRLGYGRARQKMDNYLYQLIAARRVDMRESMQGNLGANSGTNEDEASDLLGGMIAAGLDDELIRDQLLTIFIAGHDTSTALLAWTLYLVATHPECQVRLHDEIDGVIGRREPRMDDLGHLVYLEQVIKESLRLYPPIHLGSRMTATDLEFQGYALPAGTRILYSIYLSHRHKGYWPEADCFDPERFTPEASRQRPPYLYLPFGGGPRNCIGMAFAQVEAKVVLARLLQRFHFSYTGHHLRPRMGATLEPHPRVMVKACVRI